MSATPALLVLLALAAAPRAQDTPPITVVGHPWAPFISPMGEPFRAHSTGDDTLAAWFAQADRNHDGVLTVAEMIADAERFFRTLDANHDGQIDPDELDIYEWQVAPEIQVNSRTRRAPGELATAASPSGDSQPNGSGRRATPEADSSLGLNGALQGAARYALLNIPEPVAAADADFNRAISLDEFRRAAVERFQLLDSTRQGKITLHQLQELRQRLEGAARGRRHDHQSRDDRLGNPVPRQP